MLEKVLQWYTIAEKSCQHYQHAGRKIWDYPETFGLKCTLLFCRFYLILVFVFKMYKNITSVNVSFAGFWVVTGKCKTRSMFYCILAIATIVALSWTFICRLPASGTDQYFFSSASVQGNSLKYYLFIHQIMFSISLQCTLVQCSTCIALHTLFGCTLKLMH